RGRTFTSDAWCAGPGPDRKRADDHRCVHAVFTGRGRGMKGILSKMSITDQRTLHTTMHRNDIRGNALPKDLTGDQWAGLYSELAAGSAEQRPQDGRKSTPAKTDRKNSTK